MPTTWTLARRAERLEPSVIRELLKLADRPGVVSLAGGLPAAELFPLDAVRAASARVLAEAPHAALQYAASEGFQPLREWVARHLAAQGMTTVSPAQVLITNGSQQGLDLLAKVLVDPGSTVAVEAPTYLGALQAFAPFEPAFAAVACDDDGPLPDALTGLRDARLLYLLPNFQNPTGRLIGADRRRALAATADAIGLPLVEDDPYGELWYDAPPPLPLAALNPAGTVYLGSFSKVLVPGLRLGYVVAPPALVPKLLQAKQAADLHTGGYVQRLAHAMLADGLLETHLPRVRAVYRQRRDAMQAALARELPPGCRWRTPVGGMFFWVELPAQVDATALLPRAVAAGVAFVPGAPFFAGAPRAHTLRLSFVTVSPALIDDGVARLAAVLRTACREMSPATPDEAVRMGAPAAAARPRDHRLPEALR